MRSSLSSGRNKIGASPRRDDRWDHREDIRDDIHDNNYWGHHHNYYGYGYHGSYWGNTTAWAAFAGLTLGVLIATLPPRYETVVYSGTTYYYANGTYYVLSGSQYRVVPAARHASGKLWRSECKTKNIAQSWAYVVYFDLVSDGDNR